MSDYNIMGRRERDALDRHITGNYGEDQFTNMREDDRLTGDGSIDELDVDETEHKIVFTIRYETGQCRILRLDKLSHGGKPNAGTWEEL